MTAPTQSTVETALRTVVDPEVGLNIVDLGLIYHIVIEQQVVSVEMTMTTPACPMGSMLQEDTVAALEAILPEGWHAAVSLVWEPEWTPQRMSDAARAQLGW